MQNSSAYQLSFQKAFLKLCESSSDEGVEKLKEILSQDKSEMELLLDIITAFPQFKNILNSELLKNI